MTVFLMEDITAYEDYWIMKAYPLTDPIVTKDLLFELKIYRMNVAPAMQKWFHKPKIHVFLYSKQGGSWDYSFIYSLLEVEFDDFNAVEFDSEDFTVVV